jgi:hypothetical protein
MGSSEFLELDSDRLDEQWLEQPRLYHKYARKLANAKQTLEECKARLELVKAELGREIRLNPLGFGLEKITEAVVANTIIIQQGYKDAQEEYIAGKHRVDVVQAVVTTLDHRKRALEGLVTLHGQDYFSTPRAKDQNSRDLIDRVESDAVRKKIRTKN